MSNFYTILTNIGAALHANAQVQQTTVAWTHMALGDGNGNPVVPQQTQAGLVREVHRLPITSLEQHPDNPNWIVVEAVVPSDVGGWTVRETALYGGAGGGSCIAVGNYPATYKPVLAEGAAREMVMRMVIEVSSVATVKLVIDPAVAIASRKWVESLVATPAKAGLVKLATVDEAKEGLRGDVAVTPEGLDAALDGIGGLPRFTPYLWGGRGDATPGGDTQSSGHQLLDLMYPTMRVDVMASQLYCTEAEWQADAYKRVTHWSLGDGVSWMRPPDKNGVQPGNVGAFYGAGSNPAGGKTGTAVIDAMRNLTGAINVSVSSAVTAAGVLTGTGVFSNSGTTVRDGPSQTALAGIGSYFVPKFDASLALPAGTTTDPIAGEFRPRTWYGIWMIRMYGRVVNPGTLDAAGLNARMDMMDARVATLEAIPKPPGYQQVAQNITASTVTATYYPNATTRVFRISVAATTASPGTVGHVSIQRKLQDGSVHNAAVSSNADGVGVGCEALIYPGESWAVSTRLANLVSVIKTS
ncbi:phage tail protein [Comamonas aquatica]|uniref:phage tail protein n=1 Tax=Comamonas aquatica TaxID=225991 RepID=UPI002446D3D8|nr:phage tail protein [Comamonas aquatica]MDH0380658.1 phage tail protein [Comamonas aquatica]MDH0429197.1 phage tail protein [Comamonas aquatica]MDH0940023.1 phage tail protein [Comamonas aquatica]